jgi:hypothetical protein
MKRRITIIIALLISTVTIAVWLGMGTAKITLVSRDGQRVPLTVQVADNLEERRQGLMYRESIEPFAGMLFVAPEPEMMSFWMKNTVIPLDVIFFDTTGNFVSSTSMIPCLQDPCPQYESQAQAKYGLEVPAGFVQEHGVRVGWSMEWRGNIAGSPQN